MRLQAVNAISTRAIAQNERVKTNKQQKISLPVVNFKGNPQHVIFYGAEYPDYDKKGGVANVMGYYDKFPKLEKAIVQPYYRARKDYNIMGEYTGKIEPHKFSNDCKYPGLKGQYFYSKIDFEKKNLLTETTTNLDSNINGNFIVLKEIASKDVTYGKQPEQTIRLFRAMSAVPVKNESGEIIDYKLDELKEIQKDADGNIVNTRIKNHFFVLSKGTGEFKVPYDDGSYSSDRSINPEEFSAFKPRPYAENNRAFVEFKNDINKATITTDGKPFEAGTVVCSDSQTAYTLSFMRDEAIKGSEGFAPEVVSGSYVIHNLRKGYTGECGGLDMALNLGLTAEEIEIMRKDPEYIAFEEKGELDNYFGKYIGELRDVSGSFNPTLIAFDLREKGYSTGLNTVSKGYADDLANNTNIPTALQERWAKLVKNNKAVGIMNPFEDPGFHIFHGVKGMNGYLPNEVAKIQEKLKNMGDEFAPLADEIHPFPNFDSSKFVKNENGEYTVSQEAYNDLIAYKQACKKEFLNRLTTKFDKLITKDKDLYNTIIAGRPNWNVNLIGKIDEELLKPENIEKVKVYASWGRLDSQKSLDIVMAAFDQFCTNNPEEAKYSVLILGGEAPGTKYSDQILTQARELSIKYPGHVAFMEAFAPNKILASAAEAVLLPSREAPCELTDVETMQFLTMLTATNAQGMADKNFDPSENIETATSFKTETGYYLSQKEISDYKKMGIGEAWEKDYAALIKEVQTVKQNKEASSFVAKNNDFTPSLEQYINASPEFKEKLENMLDLYRSLILTAGVALCMERGLKLTDAEKLKICENQLNLKTGWETNHKLTGTNKPSAELYRTIFATTPEAAENYTGSYLDKLRAHLDNVKETLQNKTAATANTINQAGKTTTNTNTNTIPKISFLGKYGKYIGGAVLVAGAIGAAVHYSKNNSKVDNKPKTMLNKIG